MNPGRCKPQVVLKIIHLKPRLSDSEMVIFNHLKRFVTECDTKGIIQTYLDLWLCTLKHTRLFTDSVTHGTNIVHSLVS